MSDFLTWLDASPWWGVGLFIILLEMVTGISKIGRRRCRCCKEMKK